MYKYYRTGDSFTVYPSSGKRVNIQFFYSGIKSYVLYDGFLSLIIKIE